MRVKKIGLVVKKFDIFNKKKNTLKNANILCIIFKVILLAI